MFQNIIRHIVMHGHGSLRHGICHIHQCRVFLIMYFHKSCCLNSCNIIFCNDSCHVISIITDPLIQKTPVLNILMRRLHRPGMSRRTKINLRLIQIKSSHNTIGNGTVYHLRHHHRLCHQILCIFRLARYLGTGIHTLNAFSNPHNAPPSAFDATCKIFPVFESPAR